MSRFKQYATNVGFRVELTKAQLNFISHLAVQTDHAVSFGYENGRSASALLDKGLVHWTKSDGYQLTEEGKLLVPLLRKCDLLRSERTFQRAKLPTYEGAQDV